jgi:hypothetical protein
MSVFSRVWVDNVMRGGTLIYWQMDDAFTDPGPWEFQAQWGRTVNGPWTDLSIVPVQDTYYTVDPESHLYAKQIDLYYRVRVTSGAARTFYSDPTRADGGLPERDWRIAREIIRKEYLYYMKSPGGIRGCLLKRRNWGDRCTECTDYDTGEVSKPKCYTCYGTGIVGGYYPPFSYWVLMQGQRSQRISRDDQKGMQADKTMTVRGVAYPYIESGDIWVSTDNDRRWVVNGMQEVTIMRTRPVVLNLELRLAPASDIIYDFPLDSCGTGGSAREPEDPCVSDGEVEELPEFCLPPIPDV